MPRLNWHEKQKKDDAIIDKKMQLIFDSFDRLLRLPTIKITDRPKLRKLQFELSKIQEDYKRINQ